MADLKSLIERLKRELAEARSDLSRLEGERDAAVASLDAASLRLMALEKALAASEAAYAKLRQEAEARDRDRDAHVADLESELASLQGAVQQLKKELAAAKDGAERLLQERDLAQSQARAERERCASKAAEVERILQALADKTHAAALLDSRVQELQDALRKAVREQQVALKALDEARAAWELERDALSGQISSLQATLDGVIEAGQAMYVSVARPSGGAASGLGLILQARDADGGTDARVCEVVVGSVAAVDGRIRAGDSIVSVGDTSVEHLTTQEIETLMCGPMWAPVAMHVRSERGEGEMYRVELVRGFVQDPKAAARALVGLMRKEVCLEAERMHEDLEASRAKLLEQAAQHERAAAAWRQEKDGLNRDLEEARFQEERALQRAKDAENRMLEHEESFKLHRSRYQTGLEGMAHFVREWVGGQSARIARVEEDHADVDSSFILVRTQALALEKELAGLVKEHDVVRNELGRCKAENRYLSSSALRCSRCGSLAPLRTHALRRRQEIESSFALSAAPWIGSMHWLQRHSTARRWPRRSRRLTCVRCLTSCRA